MKVRYHETDQMGVVYHTNYLNWFEIGRTELIRELGMTYRKIEEKGIILPLLEAEMKFKRPARYDDTICIRTRIAEYSPVRMHFESEIHLETEDGPLLVNGATKHVWLDRNWKPVRIDKEAAELYDLIRSQ